MTNRAMIEVYGPLDELERAVEALPEATGSVRGRLDALVVDAGDQALIVWRDLPDAPAIVSVDGPDTDLVAVRVFHELAAVLGHRIVVVSADSGDVLAERAALPAA